MMKKSTALGIACIGFLAGILVGFMASPIREGIQIKVINHPRPPMPRPGADKAGH